MRYKASFRPQTKRTYDGAIHCVPPHGETDWDATDYVETLTETDLANAFEPDTHGSDLLRQDPNCAEWCREWTGPFYVTLEEVTDEEMKEYQEFRLSIAGHGQECPLCHSGTVENVEIGEAGSFDTENRCRGECGAVAYAGKRPIRRPLAVETLDGKGFTVADLLTVRNLVVAFEEHLKQESHRLDVPVETLCPCSGDEVKAARELLCRLDPLMVL